jgi:hypothetical protein
VDLGRLGCTYLQIDEVPIAVLCDPKNQDRVGARGEDPEQLIGDYIAAINEAVRDRPAGMTVCVRLWPWHRRPWPSERWVRPVAERLFQGTNVTASSSARETFGRCAICRGRRLPCSALSAPSCGNSSRWTR